MIQSKATRLKVEALRLELMFSCHFGLYEGPKELTDAFRRQKIQVCNYSYSKERTAVKHTTKYGQSKMLPTQFPKHCRLFTSGWAGCDEMEMRKRIF